MVVPPLHDQMVVSSNLTTHGKNNDDVLCVVAISSATEEKRGILLCPLGYLGFRYLL